MRIKRIFQIAGIVVVVLVAIGVGISFAVISWMYQDPFAPMYAENCAACHGDTMEGGAQGRRWSALPWSMERLSPN